MTLQDLEENEVWLKHYGLRLDFKGYVYYWCIPEWDRLLPTENTIEFSDPYVRACHRDPVDCIGTYSNGWEL